MTEPLSILRPNDGTPYDPNERGKRRPFTVSEVMSQVKACLEDGFRPLWVRGEISNCRQPRSGHIYLTLRDPRAALRVVIYARLAEQMVADLRDGDEVQLWGTMTAFAPAGDAQLIASHVELLGEGALRARREALRRKLDAEGLFDPSRKRPLPRVPRTVGVVTSPTSAALRDVVTTLERRFPGVHLIVSPTRVSGARSGEQIARAIQRLDACGRVDVLLVVRGGGAQEELAAFDQEAVVRAIAACRTPTITGVGHETDTTLADFAADRRAPTPTAAAELAVPVKAELQAAVELLRLRLVSAMATTLADARARLDAAVDSQAFRAPQLRVRAYQQRLKALERRLSVAAPGRRVRRQSERLDEVAKRLGRARRVRLQAARRELEVAQDRLDQVNPRPAVRRRGERLRQLEVELKRAVGHRLERHGAQLREGAARLEALSPLGVLGRGFSVTTDATGRVLRAADAVRPGDVIRTRLERGTLEADVRRVEDEP